VIAISRSAANDLHLYTGFPADRTHIAYPIIESVFRPIDQDEAALVNLANEPDFRTVDFAIFPERFILSVTGIHHAKNVSLLVSGFLKAARELGDGCGLVIVLPSAWAKAEFDRKFPSSPQIITVADVSERELALLYNRAHMVVQPSMYEGFGYPVAEAMSCGAAVIATNTSSIPEIAGYSALLVSPRDVNMLAAAIIRIARDRELRTKLKRGALERSALFRDPRALGSVTLDAYRSAVGRTHDGMPGQPAAASVRRPRVAIWSSMPPKDCGVADYSSELAVELTRTYDVDVFVDGKYDPTPSRSLDVRFRHPEDYGIEGEPDRNIYQIGARRGYQDFMYPYIRKHRGTMVVHDITMGQAFYYIAKWNGTLNEFEDEVVWPEGLSVLDEYERLGANSTSPPHELLRDLFGRHKMLQWIVNHADRLVVHTAPLRERLLEYYPQAKVQVVHMGVADWIPVQRHLPRVALRRALGLRGTGICVGCFGIMDRIKRIGAVIESFVGLCKKHPGSVLMLVGSCYDSSFRHEMNLQIEESGVADRVVVLDYVPPDALHTLMALTDVVVNLRSPDQLGLSAILLRALAAAKPVIISAIAEWRIFPAGTCLSVTAGSCEVEQLTALLVELAGNSPERERYGHSARRWFLQNGTLSKMAQDYMSAESSGVLNSLSAVSEGEVS
jgi:glycosyltransferase involved in cell wall biosynthesis